MKCRCPACGRSTAVPPDLLGHLMRCDRCATLLKPFIHRDANDPAKSGLAAKVAAPGRYREESSSPRLPLADLLTRQPKEQGAAAGLAVPARVPSPRQKALRRAELRWNHQMLGTLTLVGAITLGLLTLGAISLKFLPVTRSANAEVLHIQDAHSPTAISRH